MRHSPKEALAEQGPDLQRRWVLAKDRAPLGVSGLGRGSAQVAGVHSAGESSCRGAGRAGEGEGVLGTPLRAQLLAVLAEGASPAPTLLGAAQGVLPPPAPHPQAGLAMHMHFWEAPFLRLVPAHPYPAMSLLC